MFKEEVNELVELQYLWKIKNHHTKTYRFQTSKQKNYIKSQKILFFCY